MDLPTIVPNDWSLVMSTSDISPWVPLDEFMVKNLGLTNAHDTPHSYIKLCGTWRDVRHIPTNMEYVIIYIRIWEFHMRGSYETLGMMEGFFSHGTGYILEVDIGSESQQDEDGEQRWKNYFMRFMRLVGRMYGHNK
jgi:hypothetical protein